MVYVQSIPQSIPLFHALIWGIHGLEEGFVVFCLHHTIDEQLDDLYVVHRIDDFA